jgi:hypothetical protein
MEAAMGSYAILDLTSPWFWIAAAIIVLLLIAALVKVFLFGIAR